MDYVYREIPPGPFAKDLSTRRDVAGLIADDGLILQLPAASLSGLAVVALGPGTPYPSALLDDVFDLERLFRRALEIGHRSLCIVTGIEAGTTRAAWGRAVRATGAGASLPRVQWCILNPGTSPMALRVHAAFQATRAMLGKGDQSFDTFVVTDDFDAQGVIDALTSSHGLPWNAITLLTFSNRARPFHVPFRLECLEADGAAAGRAMAELLSQQLSGGGRIGSLQLPRAWRRVEGARDGL